MNLGWHLTFTGWPWWLVLPLAGAGVWALLRLYRLELAALPPRLRRRLLLLRGGALALLLLFFLEPTLTRNTTEKVLPLVAVVVDQSGSMAVKDEMMAPGAKLAEAIGLGLLPATARPVRTNAADQAASDQAVVAAAKPGSAVANSLAALACLSRYERAVKLARQKVLPPLRDQARVKVFALDTGLVPLDLDRPAKGLPNRATDFEAGLAALARQWARDYVGGLVLLSDGRQSSGADPTPVIRSLQARGARLAAILVGDPGVPPDAVVAELSGSSEVFLGEQVPLAVRYRISGADSLDWDLVLTQGGQELDRRKVRGNGQWQYEKFTFTATNAGLQLYQARLELAREQRADFRAKTNAWKEASLANNAAEASVMVNQDPIQVLLVDSTPRWESRYLAAMFERDRRVHFTRRYHSVLLEEPNRSLLPKNQAEWDAYDMVCLGDLDANELPPEQQKQVGNFVARRGGFLVCVAGPRGLPKAFSLGALANLLPVRVALASGREPEPVAVALTPEGAEHPILQILSDPSLNQRLWPLLPPLQWVADSVVAKPGATVLLTAQNPARTPILAVQRYGAGRVMWMGTEESWRWRDRLGERVHQTFWLQAMRWGLAGRLRGQTPKLRVGLDRSLMAPGESAELKARVSLEHGEPAPEPPIVKIERLDENGASKPESVRTLEMAALADAPGIWRLELNGLAEGTWRLTTSHPNSQLKGLTEVRDLLVGNPNALEGLDLGGDLAGLNRLATAGGHCAGTMEQADAILKDFAAKLKPRHQEHRETVRLWNSYLSMSLVMALLCTEWVLRKRQGLP